MRHIILALLLAGCGSPMLENEQEAQDYIYMRFAELGLEGSEPGETITTWYFDQQCIPAPWDDPNQLGCRYGRAWVIPGVCFVETVWRDTSNYIGQTSYCHELYHCWKGPLRSDPGHSDPAWRNEILLINAELIARKL